MGKSPGSPFLEPLIMGLLQFVMRLESCFSIREKALHKALQILRRLNVDRDESMMRKAKSLTPPENLLCSQGKGLIA
jgi:hypothetical protein